VKTSFVFYPDLVLQHKNYYYLLTKQFQELRVGGHQQVDYV